MQASAPAIWLYYLAAQPGAQHKRMNPVDPNVAGSGAHLPRRRRELSPDDYVNGVLAGDRGVLARAITLIESASPLHQAQAQEVLQRVLPHTGRSQRIGITGVPGVGKSTFIERFGCFVIE